MDRDQFYIKPERVQLKRLLTNEGGIGEVWLGTLHEESGQHDVAEERLMFTRETAVLFMAALRCHNVCKGKMCIVMKLYRESMLSRMRRYPGGKLPLAEVQRYGLEICKAVAELHDQNIISQDLKPPNFLIGKLAELTLSSPEPAPSDDLDHCVVADFGISRVIEKTIGVHMPSNVQGTFNYMSPESFDPELFGGVTFKADSWSFACSLIEMLSGVKPWDGIKMAPIVRKVLNKEIPQIPPGLPSPLENLIRVRRMIAVFLNEIL
ncbi:hypothetical protein GUITHDRAFT_146555 [Guillardia theta CCMP2712]|uniref:Protein kinase domain-containing protein n=1 Tax=Guillardia theta (strain CCMP2712) TaxID=905079 RepID=L1IGK8_GUITC|nr:hypothetical protein GUITHDRAFT_146555 [Guillardia theta CCMP2712]EKX35353.1 hypothetical protein GUITHDRAFT_146555 [Guillardia theta CCMP2712]|eukprot:XP_005822333.1 hypothetical protein GUITHDRAFT_146555 [Guillardia theta CCMP2712]